MNVAQMIKELQKMGFKVDARRRTDGGWIITKINDMSFTGASGNQYARQVLGVELSQARIEQVHFNVTKYIQGSKKPKEAIDEDMERQLKKVQRQWRKHKVEGKITKKKLRWHIKQGGKEEAKEYLTKMERYGQGLAYEANVEFLAKYIEDIARAISNEEFKGKVEEVVALIRAKKETFKEAWIHQVYEWWYDVPKFGYSATIIMQARNKTINLIS